MFRFAIRDVLWLTVVVALAIALWLERQRSVQKVLLEQQQTMLWRSRSEAALEAIKGRGMSATWYERGIAVTIPAEVGEGGHIRVYSGPER